MYILFFRQTGVCSDIYLKKKGGIGSDDIDHFKDANLLLQPQFPIRNLFGQCRNI